MSPRIRHRLILIGPSKKGHCGYGFQSLRLGSSTCQRTARPYPQAPPLLHHYCRVLHQATLLSHTKQSHGSAARTAAVADRHDGAEGILRGAEGLTYLRMKRSRGLYVRFEVCRCPPEPAAPTNHGCFPTHACRPIGKEKVPHHASCRQTIFA